MTESVRTDRQMLTIGVPVYRDHVDCAGITHRFKHVPHEITEGAWSLIAKEVDPPLLPGYEIHSKVSPSIYVAYMDLLTKIRDAMACKHLHWPKDGEPDVLAGTLQGRIADGGLVIDGRRLSFEEFVRLLSTYEGFPLKLTLGRPND